MRKTIALLTALSFGFGPVWPILGPNTAIAGLADEGGDGGPQTILNTVNTGLQGAQSAMHQFGATQAQIGQMVQFGQSLNMKNGIISQNFGLLQQVQGQLSMAFAEADQCFKQADQSGDKKFAKLIDEKNQKKTDKNLAAAKIVFTPGQLERAEPTCENYDHIAKSAEFAIHQTEKTNRYLGCMRNLQNKIDTLVQSAKQPFSQLTLAATEAVNIRDQIIKQYEDTEKKITGDLEGENGYIAKLEELKQISATLNSTLSGAPGSKIKLGDNEVPAGIGRRIQDLKNKRNAVANKWHYQFMTGAIQCYQSDQTMACDSSGNHMAPAQCVASYVQQNTEKSSAKSAVNARNMQILGQAFGAIRQHMKDVKPTALDANKMDDFLKYSRTSFGKVKTNMIGTLKRYQFVGGVNGNDIGNFFGEKMQDCYENEVRNFESSLKSSGGDYFNEYNGIKEEEKNLANEASNWVNLVTEKMTSFRTAFTKTYQNDLKIFAQGCESGSAYDSVECLQRLSAMLKDGLAGRAPNGVIAMSVPVMQLDSTGRPTMGQSTVHCGLEECLSHLIKTRDYNRDQAATQKREREKFTAEHNKLVQATVGAVSAQFAAIAGLMGPMTTRMNGLLGGLGVSEALKVKAIKGEALETDEKTGLFKVPGDMKKALANNSAYMEIENLGEMFGKLDKQKAEFKKKHIEALKIKSECEVAKEDYQGLFTKLERSCPAACDNLGSIAQSVEKIISKSGKNPVSKSYSRDAAENSKYFRSCFNDGPSISTADAMLYSGESDTRKRQRVIEATLKKQKHCVSELIGELGSKNESSRAKYKESNNNFIGHLEAIGNACVIANTSVKEELKKDAEAKAKAACEAMAGEAKEESDKQKVEEDKSERKEGLGESSK